MLNEEKIVCVIEDNKPIRTLYTTILRKAGIKTVDFGLGKEALGWLENNIPAIIVTDLLLPDVAVDDISKFMINKNYNEKVIIIVISGLTHSDYEHNYKQYGFDYFLTKPIDTNALIKLLNSLLNK